MINYAMDEIRFESLASCFRVFAKGWILSKKYVVSVRCNGKEIYQFSGNQKRYDICIAYHVEITEDVVKQFEKLKNSDAFFARKIDAIKNADLYHKINKELNKTEI